MQKKRGIAASTAIWWVLSFILLIIFVYLIYKSRLSAGNAVASPIEQIGEGWKCLKEGVIKKCVFGI